MNKTIGEKSGESCSMCGRANTWHPDCPICKYIIDLESMIQLATEIIGNMDSTPTMRNLCIDNLKVWSTRVSRLIK